VPVTFPRVRLVPKVQLCSDVKAATETMDLSTTAAVMEPVELGASDTAAAGLAVITEDQPGSVEIKTASSGNRFLVLSESYYSGWQATVDGKPAKVVRAYGDFMGCVVPPGSHTIQFRFAPFSLALGKWLTLAGLALAVLIFLLSRRASPSLPGR
jgi:hypothetical protein